MQIILIRRFRMEPLRLSQDGTGRQKDQVIRELELLAPPPTLKEARKAGD